MRVVLTAGAILVLWLAIGWLVATTLFGGRR